MDAESQARDLARRALARARSDRGTAAHSAGRSDGARTAGVHVRVGPCEAPGDEAAACAPGATLEPAPKARRPGRDVLSAEDLRATPDGGTFRVPPGAIVTPLARDEARRRGVRLVEGAGAEAGGGRSGPLFVAVGSDHGGYEMKVAVCDWLKELGHRVLDLGTHDETACDYPDFARAVAEAVANGQVDLGVVVDGAGIGSAMAANKVPGIHAANCWDERTAKNAREHNLANVLTLGGRILDPLTIRATLAAFLSTPLGTGRHARRAAKIDAIEQRYSKPTHRETLR